MRNLAWSMLLGFVFALGLFQWSVTGQRNAAVVVCPVDLARE